MLNIFKSAILDDIAKGMIKEKRTTPTKENFYSDFVYYWIDEDDNVVGEFSDKDLAIEFCKRWLFIDDEE